MRKILFITTALLIIVGFNFFKPSPAFSVEDCIDADSGKSTLELKRYGAKFTEGSGDDEQILRDDWSTTKAQTPSDKYSLKESQGYLQSCNGGDGSLVPFYDCTRQIWEGKDSGSGKFKINEHFNTVDSFNDKVCNNKKLVGYIYSTQVSNSHPLRRCESLEGDQERPDKEGNSKSGGNRKTLKDASCSNDDGILGYALDNPEASPTPDTNKVLVKIEVAEDPSITKNVKVINAPFTNLDLAENVLTDFTFENSDPGIKTVCTRFTASDGTTEIKCKNIEFVGPGPTITEVICTRQGSNDSEVKFVIKGENFGQTTGKVTTDDKTHLLKGTWSQTSLETVLTDVEESNEDILFTVARFDGEIDSSSCNTGLSSLSVGADYFCPAVPDHVENDVTLQIFDGDNPGGNKGKLHEKKVKISNKGVIRDIGFTFEKDKKYIASIESPKSLKRFGQFIAEQEIGKTNIVDIKLPIGDISPGKGDGIINSLDKSELNKQWSLDKSVTTSGDFNSDNRVNSIDWACMRFNFDESDEMLEEFVDEQVD